MNHLNSGHKQIQFTNEHEQNGQLALLDLLVIGKPNGNFGRIICRKETH